MLNLIEEILKCFRPCFSKEAAYGWFVKIVVGLMVRSDTLGITSIIRDLAMNPALYSSMEYFFQANSWSWEDIFRTWVQMVCWYAPMKRTLAVQCWWEMGQNGLLTGDTCPVQKR